MKLHFIEQKRPMPSLIGKGLARCVSCQQRRWTTTLFREQHPTPFDIAQYLSASQSIQFKKICQPIKDLVRKFIVKSRISVSLIYIFMLNEVIDTNNRNIILFHFSNDDTEFIIIDTK
jgi:hypothetical protein